MLNKVRNTILYVVCAAAKPLNGEVPIQVENRFQPEIHRVFFHHVGYRREFFLNNIGRYACRGCAGRGRPEYTLPIYCRKPKEGGKSPPPLLPPPPPRA
jgi:hypothetical protein